MKDTRDRLYDLLPQVYRRRDAEHGHPLRALLQVIAGQVEVAEKDITQLYENWFIETCQDWVVPYIADLIGYEPVHDAGQPGDLSDEEGLRRNKILIPRAEVANTIRNRRRKGTLYLLELLAQDVAQWPSRAVEFYNLLSCTQNVNHVRRDRGRTADLRRSDLASRVNTPFDETAHTIDVRRPNSHRTPGRYNVPSIGLFVWRLRAYSITKSPAYLIETGRPHWFTFSAMANDFPLFTKSTPDPEQTRIAGELNLPVRIRREALEAETVKLPNDKEAKIASAEYYGPDKSFAIWAEDWPAPGAPQPIPRERVIAANLQGWQQEPPSGYVAVDPERGRIAFPPEQLPPKKEKAVLVSYHYGFATEIGGGEYDRPIFEPAAQSLALSLFRPHHFKNPDGLVEKLASDSPDPVSKFLYERFSDNLKGLLQSHDGNNSGKSRLSEALADELNALLQAEALDGEDCFKEFGRTDEIRQLLQRQAALREKGEELGEQEQIRLNRLLLEAAYRDEIFTSFKFYRVGPGQPFEEILPAIDKWSEDRPLDAVIEIADSGVYTQREPINVVFNENQRLQLRAAQRTRPAIRLLDIIVPGRDALNITGAPHSRFALDGVMVFGRGLYFEKTIEEVTLRHCTLVPGWELAPGAEGKAKNPNAPSLQLVDTEARLNVEHSILGTIIVRQNHVETEPMKITLRDSIVDACSDEVQPGEHREAISADPLTCTVAHATLAVLRSTIIGHVHVFAVDPAENSIFTGIVRVAHSQIGCMRFCYVPLFFKDPAGEEASYSRTPRRYNCQPDLAVTAAMEKLPPAQRTEENRRHITEQEQPRVQPQFHSRFYGTPDYCRLAEACPNEIKRGADDESEMGVYHDLFQPQREANLRIRLEEYTPAGMDAGVFFAS